MKRHPTPLLVFLSGKWSLDSLFLSAGVLAGVCKPCLHRLVVCGLFIVLLLLIHCGFYCLYNMLLPLETPACRNSAGNLNQEDFNEFLTDYRVDLHRG